MTDTARDWIAEKMWPVVNPYDAWNSQSNELSKEDHRKFIDLVLSALLAAPESTRLDLARRLCAKTGYEIREVQNRI